MQPLDKERSRICRKALDCIRKVEAPQQVADVHATVLTALGIDPRHEELAPIGRPIKFSEGQAIAGLLQ